MHRKALLHHIVPLPDLDADSFEARLRDDVMPAVDTGPTRGGQITGQNAYRGSDGHFRWLVHFETMGGSWPDGKLSAARGELERIGVVYALDDLEPLL